MFKKNRERKERKKKNVKKNIIKKRTGNRMEERIDKIGLISKLELMLKTC